MTQLESAVADMKNRNNIIVKFVVWYFLYLSNKPYFIINKYRNILRWVCIIIYLIYKRDALFNI